MVFSSQVWAGCKQASAKEADLKKNGLVPTRNHGRLHSPPRNQALAAIVWSWTVLVQ